MKSFLFIIEKHFFFFTNESEKNLRVADICWRNRWNNVLVPLETLISHLKKAESLKLYRKHTCVWLVTLRNWILLIQTAATLIYWISLNNVTVSNGNFYSSKTIAWNKGCTRSSIKVIPFLENQAFVAFSIFVENVLNFVSPPPAKTQCISILKHYNHFTRAGWN